MKDNRHRILSSAAVIIIIAASLFFTVMISGALRLPQTFSYVFHETYEVLGGFDVYLNGKLIAQDISGSFIGPDTGNFSDEYVLKTRIENVSTSYSDPTLCFRSYSSAVEVYQDGRKVFSLADQNPIGESASFSGGRYNFASLADDYSGSQIEIRYSTRYTQNGPYEIHPVYIGNKATLIKNEAANNFISLCIGLSVLIAAFILSMLCLAIDNRKTRQSLAATVMLLFVTGFWIVLQNRSKQFIIANVTAAIDLSMFSMAVLPLTIYNYVVKNYSEIAQRDAKAFEIFSYVYIAVYIAIYTGYAFFNTAVDSSLPFMVAALIIYFMVLILWAGVKYVKRKFEGGIFLITGLFLYLMSIVLENSILDAGSSSVNRQLSLYAPMYAAMILFLFKSVREGIQISKNRKDRRNAMRIAYTDALTGLLNRKALANRIDHMDQSGEQQFWLFIFDIDGMKECNDTFGHLMGDKVLIAFAKSLKAASKELNKYIFRYGGDEFLIMIQQEEGFRPKKFITAVRKHFTEYHPVRKYDGFSVGWALYSSGGKTGILAKLREADSRMYYEKIQNRKEREDSPPPRVKHDSSIFEP